jgi:hypothetical protein
MRRVVTGIVVGLVMVVGAGTASAHKKKFGSFLTLDAIDKRDAAGTVGSGWKWAVQLTGKTTGETFFAMRRGPNELNTTPQ